MAISITKKLLSKSLDGSFYSSASQNNTWIVIHNTGGGTASSAYNWFNNPSNPNKTSAHYCVDDTQIIQCLENNWKGHHTTGSGQKYNDKYTPSGADGVSNSNSIGIEVADWGGDYDKAKFDKAIENAIDLTISLMKSMNIDVNHVVRHGDTQGKDCPMYIMKENKWGYFKEQLANRTGGQIIENNGGDQSGSNGESGGNAGSGSSGGVSASGSTAIDVIPNVDHRPNIGNMDQVTGACLIFYPPYNACLKENMAKTFEEWGWDRKYHYIIDPTYDVDDKKNEQDDIPEIDRNPLPETAPPSNDSNQEGNNNNGSVEDGTEKDDNTANNNGNARDKDNNDNNNGGDDNNNNNGDSDNNENNDSNNTESAANSPAATEDNRIVIKGGFEKVENRLLQCYGLEDNDKVTYINRALFKNHPEKHNIMIACCIPSYDELPQEYEKVEKNIINSLSKILWANGLNTKDLWREFDLNRAPSPVIYLDRDKWKKLLTEIDKLVEWRNKKFGVVTPNYEKYIAQMPDVIMGSGSSGGNSGGSDGGSSPGGGTTPDIGGISDTAQAVWTFFTGKGFTKECTAGIMGNLQQESGMDPTRYQSGGGVGRGICQWTVGSDRFKNLEAHAASKGKDWKDLQSQLEFLDMELQGKDPTTLKYLKQYVGGYEQFKQINDINKACKVFEDSFERAGKPMMEKRYAYAKQFYDKFAGSSSASVASYTIQPREPESGGSSRLIWPVPGHNVGSGSGSKFGMRLHPIKKVMKMHNGIDIPAPGGTPIKAAAAGKVVTNSYQAGGAGNYIKIDHGNGLATVYMHMQSKSPKAVGSSVEAGETIGPVGTTGGSTGNHLHFEVHENGTPKDPLGYTNSSNTSGSIAGSTDGSGSSGGTSGGDSGGSSGSSGGSSDTVHAGIVGPLVNSPAGEIKNPGPTTNDQSMGGLEHNDWGGVMKYEVAEPEDETAKKPNINKVLTNKEYKEFCETFFSGDTFHEDLSVSKKTNFRKYWELIDIYCMDIEPYDKGLVNASDSAITLNDRLNALTKNFVTNNENMFHYNVVESGPGSEKHCVKAADELNLIAVSEDLKCEPIYPDLVIPPNYSTADYDELAKNSIPLTFVENIADFIQDTKELLGYKKKFSFDYDLLKDKEKKSLEHLGPVNFLDPYPVDDKIEELEQHYPKVLIDEIESQIYSCNHPGCPIAQPMAKNFAMLQDAMLEQSKRTEQRLVKLENILSTVMRNQARLGARININCVYYGGQCTFGKYKCIRCLHDNRVHDGAVVTLDQCLNCTRYEPILGQIYQILDETGMNGSIVMDDMQMSYSNLEAVKQLNTLTERSPKYEYVVANDDNNCEKPRDTREDIWRMANYENYLIKEKKMTIEEIEKLKEERAKKQDKANQSLMDKLIDGITNPIEGIGNLVDNVIDKFKESAIVDESKYLFRMDWNPTFFNHQEPDTKVYPAENIIARYKGEEFDMNFEEELKDLDPELDKDAIEDIQKLMELSNNNWVDTREEADTAQVNKYSSENFYFDGFAEMKAVMSSSGGSDSGGSNGGSGPSTGLGGSECRSKIVEMAKQIYADCQAGKAWYSQSPRTVDYTKPQKMSNGKVGYDCSSLVSCCYLNAGLKSMYSKSCSGGSIMDEIVNNGGQMWLCNDDGISKASPGDLIVNGSGQMDASRMPYKASISHVMVYIGNNTVIHASSPSNGIKQNELSSYYKGGKYAFIRPKDLIDADAKASSDSNVQAGDTSAERNQNADAQTASTMSLRNSSVGPIDYTVVTASVLGEIDGLSYVTKVPRAVCTSYYGNAETPSGLGLENGKTCASHNMPYGTKVYIPALKSKMNPEGIFTVTDTGGPTFDFDIYTSKSIGRINADAYILSWGTGGIAPSYSWAIDLYSDDRWNNIRLAWEKYKVMNGKLMSFYVFNPEDASIKNHKRY